MQRQRRIWFTGAVVCLVLFGAVELASSARAPDVHFIATPQYVVNEMLELAQAGIRELTRLQAEVLAPWLPLSW